MRFPRPSNAHVRLLSVLLCLALIASPSVSALQGGGDNQQGISPIGYYFLYYLRFLAFHSRKT